MEIKLYLDDKEYTVQTQKVLTGNLRNKILEIIKNKRANKLIAEIQDALKDAETDDLSSASIKLLKDGKIEGSTVAKFNEGTYVDDTDFEYTDFIIKFVKTVIDLKTIPDEIKDKMTDEFWYNQDLESLENVVTFFRGRIK